MKRKIKNIGHKVDYEENFINPNTLETQQNLNTTPLCPSKYYFSNNNILNVVQNLGIEKYPDIIISLILLYYFSQTMEYNSKQLPIPLFS